MHLVNEKQLIVPILIIKILYRFTIVFVLKATKEDKLIKYLKKWN